MDSTRMEMLSRLGDRKPGYSLDRPFYIDPDYHQVDLETIWYKDWLFAGHDCEIPNAGSYFTLQVGAYAVVVVRGEDGRINALHNSCRHRGSRVCTEHRGSSAKLVCPYHQWTYDLEGKLLYARQMGDDFDRSKFGMKPIACESAGGYIFICLAEKPADFAPFRAAMEPYFLPHRIGEVKIAYESTIIEKGNWKLVWENNRECYHCAANHPELCKTYPEAPTMTGVDDVDTDPEITEHWEKCETAGLPSRFLLDSEGQFRMMRMPLQRDAVSFTMSGRKAVQMRLSDSINMDRIGSLLMFHYPGIWNHILTDHAITFRVTPLSATETAVNTKWLVHKDAVEGIDYRLEDLIHVWTETNDEDRRIVEENARGIHSPAYEPGPYSMIHEGGVAQFVEWYSKFMQDRLSSGGRPILRSVA
ncbi:MAG: aromatic ring-hydroxylating dioxygenase subunit alpha [Rhizobiaceae bacterium]